MSMLQQIAKLLGIREDQVDGALKSDADACRFLSRRGLMLGAVGIAAGAIVPAAPLVQVTETLVKEVTIEATWGGAVPGSWSAAALYMQYRHRDGSFVTWKETP